MKVIFTVLLLGLLFFGCINMNTSVLNPVIQRDKIDCTDAFAKEQKTNLERFPCGFVAMTNGWKNSDRDPQYMSIIKDTGYCWSGGGSALGENVNNIYFSNFMIEKHATNTNENGTITAREDRVYLVEKLEMKLLSSSKDGFNYWNYFEVVSASCQVVK
ncbi:MAG: hypothetical protein WC263_02035 [Candidatus Micrarchaeia archaeon]|jgi:hypothetical protein